MPTELRAAPSPTRVFDLDGRVALVTGGSRGIGRATARLLAAGGARVAVAARSEAACAVVAEEIEEGGGEALVVTGHVGRPDEIDGIVGRVVDAWGRLDILVNNAGANPHFAPITDASPEAFDRAMAVNVRGPIQLAGAAADAWMGANGGAIVNVVSAAALKAEPMFGVYSACKAAMISATRTLARELGVHGIRVNAVAPGVIETDFSRLIVDTPQLHDHVLAQTPMRRIGTPEDVAGSIAFLASDAAAYVNGAVLVVDGGMLA